MYINVGFGIKIPYKDYGDVIEKHPEYLSDPNRSDSLPVVRFISAYGYSDYDKWACLIYVVYKENVSNFNYSESSGIDEYSPELTSTIMYELDKAHRIFTGYAIDRSKIKLMVVRS